MIDRLNADFEHETELPAVITDERLRAVIIRSVGLHLEVMPHQIFGDAECRLIELFIAHHRTDLLIGKERCVT